MSEWLREQLVKMLQKGPTPLEQEVRDGVDTLQRQLLTSELDVIDKRYATEAKRAQLRHLENWLKARSGEASGPAGTDDSQIPLSF